MKPELIQAALEGLFEDRAAGGQPSARHWQYSRYWLVAAGRGRSEDT